MSNILRAMLLNLTVVVNSLLKKKENGCVYCEI